MTRDDFRKLALSFPEAIQSAHMRHPDFRVGGKIFATLGYPNEDSAVVKLSRDEQTEFVQSNPEVFKPVKGAWGPARQHKHSSSGGEDGSCARGAHGSMAEHSAETAIEKSLTQADCFADALHH